MSECWGQHWGEIPLLPDLDSGIAAVERAEISQAIGLDPLKMECPQNESGKAREEDVRHVPIGNPNVLHSIKLLQFLRQLNDNNVRQELSRESVPQLITSNEMHGKELNIFTIDDRNLSLKSVKSLLRRAVIIMTVFHGYHFTNQSVIDLLVDILSEYMSRLCQTIRTTSDSLELMSSNDFIDIIDRVFHDMNVSDFESLRQYDSDLRLYNQNLIKEVNKKIGINESMNSSIRNSFQMDSNCDNLYEPSVPTQPEVKEHETNPSLKSLLSSYKTTNTEESEQLFDLTSLTNSSSNKGTES